VKTFRDVIEKFERSTGQSFSTFRREAKLSLRKQEEKILENLKNAAFNTMEVCRIINGVHPRDTKRCFQGRLRQFKFEMYKKWGDATIPERCSFIENRCCFWYLDVYETLRRMEKQGKVKSALLRWLNGPRKLDKFRFWFTNPENLRNRLLRDAQKLRKILLILPCNKYAEVGNYKLGRNWKMVLKRIEPWRDRIDLAAIDCINMLGLVPEWENYKTVGHNIYPSWEHFKNNPERLEELSIAIARKLKELAPRYERIIAYLNVKAYFLALKKASELSKIKVNFVEIDFNPISYNKNLPKLIETISVNGR